MRINIAEDIIFNKNLRRVLASELRVGDVVYVNEYYEDDERYLYPSSQIDSRTKEAKIVYISKEDSFEIEVYLDINNYGMVLNKDDIILIDNTMSTILDVYDIISELTDKYDISTVPIKADTVSSGDIIIYENNLATILNKVQPMDRNENAPITITTNKGVLNTLRSSSVNKLFIRR